MSLRERDISILEHIASYCEQIAETISRFGDDKEVFFSDQIFRNAAALCILQIGELVSVLSEEFKEQHKSMPWRQIKDMRNIVAHRYGSFDAEIVWETMKKDIPELYQYCLSILDKEEKLK